MRTVDDFAALRRAHRDGLSIRQIAKQFGPFRAAVDAILDADAEASCKQRHTASQLFRRLRDEFGYTGVDRVLKWYHFRVWRGGQWELPREAKRAL